jgi:hypothetical protein
MQEKGRKQLDTPPEGRYAEFHALRQEILQWQKFRVTTVVGSVGFFGGILSWLASSNKAYDWQLASILLLALIGCVAYTCFYWGRGNARKGAYIEVYLESPESGLGWERRLRNVRDKWRLNLNNVFGLVFFVLALLSILIPLYIAKAKGIATTRFSEKTVMLIIAAIFALLSVLNLTFRSYTRQKYVDAWKELKRREELGEI